MRGGGDKDRLEEQETGEDEEAETRRQGLKIKMSQPPPRSLCSSLLSPSPFEPNPTMKVIILRNPPPTPDPASVWGGEAE